MVCRSFLIATLPITHWKVHFFNLKFETQILAAFHQTSKLLYARRAIRFFGGKRRAHQDTTNFNIPSPTLDTSQDGIYLKKETPNPPGLHWNYWLSSPESGLSPTSDWPCLLVSIQFVLPAQLILQNALLDQHRLLDVDKSFWQMWNVKHAAIAFLPPPCPRHPNHSKWLVSVSCCVEQWLNQKKNPRVVWNEWWHFLMSFSACLVFWTFGVLVELRASWVSPCTWLPLLDSWKHEERRAEVWGD